MSKYILNSDGAGTRKINEHLWDDAATALHGLIEPTLASSSLIFLPNERGRQLFSKGHIELPL